MPARRGFLSSSISFRFFGSARRDGERVDGIVHQVAERLVHHAVARGGVAAGEARRDDRNPPVGVAARAIAGMAAMLLAFVDHLELERVERGEASFDLGGEAHRSPSSTYLE